MKLPYKHPLYVEYNEEHFKLYAPWHEQGIIFQIYANYKWRPIIFDYLMSKYIADGETKLEAARRARLVVKDFFTACDELSKIGKYCFKLRANFLDRKLIANANQQGQQVRGEDLNPTPLRDRDGIWEIWGTENGNEPSMKHVDVDTCVQDPVVKQSKTRKRKLLDVCPGEELKETKLNNTNKNKRLKKCVDSPTSESTK